MEKQKEKSTTNEKEMDYVFKCVFGKEENKKYLAYLIQLVAKDIEEIKSIDIKNPEIVRETKLGKTIHLDIKADVNGKYDFNIEMQKYNDGALFDRFLVCYPFITSSRSLRSGDKYSLVRPYCGIVFLRWRYKAI